MSADVNRTDLPAALLTIAPHVVVEARGVIWVDARGLDASAIARRSLELASSMTRRAGLAAPRVGVATSAITAEVAALHGHSPLVTVPPGVDVSFLAPFPLAVLAPLPRLAAALTDTGLETCGDLARLTRESVEVRLGTDGLALWRLTRAEDPRRIFPPASRTLPSASLAWEEYVLRHPEQLVFATNRLIAKVCDELRTWGETARALTLGLTLADRTEIERPLRASRATASRTVWMRLIRLELDRLRLADGIVGVSVRVDAAGAADAHQGDMFDRGFQTATAVDSALDQLGEDGCATLVEPAPTQHPLPERRLAWRVRETDTSLGTASGAARMSTDLGTTENATSTQIGSWPGAPRLLLQLFPAPKRVTVVTTRRHEQRVPVRFRAADGQSMELLTAIGPDRVSAGIETGDAYAREYYTCLTDRGLLVLLYRDAVTDMWYLQGWWD